MDRYLKLDLSNKSDALYFGNKFLEDREDWKMKIRKKQRELESISELPAISNSEVHSGNISKPAENAVLARLKIGGEIKRYEDYEYILSHALSRLSPEDREVIEALHFTKGKMKSVIIDELAIKMSCSSREVYRMGRTAILNFVDEVREIINE